MAGPLAVADEDTHGELGKHYWLRLLFRREFLKFRLARAVDRKRVV